MLLLLLLQTSLTHTLFKLVVSVAVLQFTIEAFGFINTGAVSVVIVATGILTVLVAIVVTFVTNVLLMLKTVKPYYEEFISLRLQCLDLYQLMH